MSQIFKTFSNIFFGSFDQTALIEGTSDIIVVEWDSGDYHSTPFLTCFGYHATVVDNHLVQAYVNGFQIKEVTFTLDKYGYLHPMKPQKQFIKKLNLKHGRNQIKFVLDQRVSLSCQIYLYSEHDKLIISDVDGTLTKDDIGGFLNNYQQEHYLHQGYEQLMQILSQRGYKIVWLTMRSLALYEFSKNYIKKHVETEGPLLTEPQQFLPALKNELFNKSRNIKTNMIKAIRKLFPQYSDPLSGGFGNRENDAIAYKACGISLENIYIVDKESKIHHFVNCQQVISYKEMKENIDNYFEIVKPYLQRGKTMKELEIPTTVRSNSDFVYLEMY